MGVSNQNDGNSLRQSLRYLPSKTPMFQHFDGRQFRFEIRRKIFTRRFNQMILIIMLHLVVDKTIKLDNGGRFPVLR